MSWHCVNYRLPDDAKRGNCQRSLSDQHPTACITRASYGFTSINPANGDYRYTEHCDACAPTLAAKLGIKPAGLKEALIFPIQPGDREAQCMSCQTRVFWVTTNTGRKMPADPNGISHFCSCPGASAHRRRA